MTKRMLAVYVLLRVSAGFALFESGFHLCEGNTLETLVFAFSAALCWLVWKGVEGRES